jgi:hypothetical protein
MPLDGRFDKKNCVGQIGSMERRPPAQSRRIALIRLKKRRQQSGKRTTEMGTFFVTASQESRPFSTGLIREPLTVTMPTVTP